MYSLVGSQGLRHTQRQYCFHVWKSQDVSCDDGGPYLTGTFAAKGRRSPAVLVSNACSTCQDLASTIQNDEDWHFPQKRIETIRWEILCFQIAACVTGPETGNNRITST